MYVFYDHAVIVYIYNLHLYYIQLYFVAGVVLGIFKNNFHVRNLALYEFGYSKIEN